MPTVSVTRSCDDPTERPIQINNVSLAPYVENNPDYPTPATFQLVVDLTVHHDFADIVFRDTRLILEILEPADVFFVGHSGRINNIPWEIPYPGGSASHWIIQQDTVTTQRLRLREDQLILRQSARPADGKTYFVGITGLRDGDNIRLAAYADGFDLRSARPHQSCEITIEALGEGDTVYVPAQFSKY